MLKKQLLETEEDPWHVEKKFNDSSEDEEKWEMEDDTAPLLNVLTFGWMEDGRLGYAPDKKNFIQNTPRPVATFRAKPLSKTNKDHFVCKSVSAGSRHTLFMMINTRREAPIKKAAAVDDKDYHSSDDEEGGEKVLKRRDKTLYTTGLTQVALCEEPGENTPVPIEWDMNDPDNRPVHVIAGRGTTFIVNRSGALFSYGHNKFGVLGHGHCENVRIPKRVKSLFRERIASVSVGGAHALALTEDGVLYSWGKNDKGQCGRGVDGIQDLTPGIVTFPSIGIAKHAVIDHSCGLNHSTVMCNVFNRSGIPAHLVYGWGDASKGQLGSGDEEGRAMPQENRWMTRFCKNEKIIIQKICAGGNHNLALTKPGGQVISWGDNSYGQLGHGDQWDNPHPKIINKLKDVQAIAAGMRHSMAIVEGLTREVMSWGYNGYGELGVGDDNLRMQPTKIKTLTNVKIHKIACGDRHSVVVASHKRIRAHQDLSLMPYFKILKKESGNAIIMRRLKQSMAKIGLNPDLLDEPDLILPNQIGSSNEEIRTEPYEAGMRYCLDTMSNPADWRRKANEVCYECSVKGIKLKRVCLSCARQCMADQALRPVIRTRQPGDACDCRTSGLCISCWSPVREAFDATAEETHKRDGGDSKTIQPRQVRSLLKRLRSPYPVEGAEVEDALLALADGREDEMEPRILPVPFEKWYRKYYDEAAEDGDADDES